MDKHVPTTEIILTQPRSTLGYFHLDWNPQPGNYLDVEGQTYLILERRHRYMLKAGRYHLHRVALYVQTSTHLIERSLINGRWIIGDSTCLYNAQSEVIRCAVNPGGPCDRCPHYQPRKSAEE